MRNKRASAKLDKNLVTETWETSDHLPNLKSTLLLRHERQALRHEIQAIIYQTWYRLGYWDIGDKQSHLPNVIGTWLMKHEKQASSAKCDRHLVICQTWQALGHTEMSGYQFASKCTAIKYTSLLILWSRSCKTHMTTPNLHDDKKCEIHDHAPLSLREAIKLYSVMISTLISNLRYHDNLGYLSIFYQILGWYSCIISDLNLEPKLTHSLKQSPI